MSLAHSHPPSQHISSRLVTAFVACSHVPAFPHIERNTGSRPFPPVESDRDQIGWGLTTWTELVNGHLPVRNRAHESELQIEIAGNGARKRRGQLEMVAHESELQIEIGGNAARKGRGQLESVAHESELRIDIGVMRQGREEDS